MIDKLSGLTVEIEDKSIQLKLRAEYNAYNVLSAYAVSVLLGEDKSKIIDLLPQLNPIKGRFDFLLSKNEVVAIIDYAHTPDALTKLFMTLSKLKTNRLITVTGCGGDRDKKKRPEMAKIAYNNSDFLILTSDDPRTEDPKQIIEDMKKGLTPNATNLKIILDRKEAIEYACTIAKSQDIILVAGKGHLNYQDVRGIKHPFDEKLILSKMLDMPKPSLCKSLI